MAEYDRGITDTLRALVAAYHEVDNQLRVLRCSLAEKRRNKAELAERICGIMTQLGLSDVKYSNSVLKYSTRRVTLPATRATIRERLDSLFTERQQQERARQLVFAPRGTEERVYIRKVRVR